MIHSILHDAPITKLIWGLWQCGYIALLLILQICADNPLIYPETAATLPAAISDV